MANIKISEFDELAEAPATGDLFLLTDISEAFDVDKTKKIKFENLVDLAAQAAAQKIVNAQASGDVFYGASASSIARLALGTQGNVLKAGASAPEYGGPFQAFKYGTASSGSNTSSSTWTDVSGASISITLPAAGDLLAFAVFTMDSQGNSGGGFGEARLVIDGTGQQEVTVSCVNAQGYRGVVCAGIKEGVSAGARTVKLQIRAYYSTTTYANTIYLFAMEFNS